MAEANEKLAGHEAAHPSLPLTMNIADNSVAGIEASTLQVLPSVAGSYHHHGKDYRGHDDDVTAMCYATNEPEPSMRSV